MSEKEVLSQKMVRATKWSFFGECAAKLVTPITSMILARILEPDDFGLLSIVTMITSFADIFIDAGFQKYLVQHKFDSEKELHEYASVAFLTNMTITTIIWLGIVIAAVPLTKLLNKPGYQWVIRIGAMKLFLTAITSVQRALYQRSLDYKTLFFVRIIVSAIPIVITVPLALILDYWALIIGVLSSEFVYAVVLTLKSKWKPRLYFSFEKLKRMFSFSVWSLVEQISIWFAYYTDTFIMSVLLSDYILGMYKQPESMLSAIYSIFTASIFGVLFSALSRYNDEGDEEGFRLLVLNTQLVAATIVFPLSVGIFLYRTLATDILLGAQWKASGIVIGYMALSYGVQIVMNNPASEIYRAKGEPKVSVCAQMIYVLCLVPITIVSIKIGFETFVLARAGMAVVFAIIHYTILKVRYQISLIKTLENIKYPIIATFIMFICVNILQKISREIFLLDVMSIFISAVVYIFVISYFDKTRDVLLNIINQIPQKGILYKVSKVLKRIVLWKKY